MDYGKISTHPGGGRSGLAEGFSRGWWTLIMIFKSDIMCCGRWQPSGFQPLRRRPPVGGMPHPGLVGFAPRAFMSDTDAPSPKDFWVVRQEKTLVLALQA